MKIVIAIVVLIVVLIPVLLFGGLMFVLDNPDIYREQLKQTVAKQTGLELSINGPVEWRYFPPIAINVSDIQLHPTGAEQRLMSLQSAAIDLRLLPLVFGGELAVDGLTVEGLTVNAKVDKNGVGNWQRADSAPAPEQTTTSEDSTPIDIGSIRIRDAHIDFEDLANQQHLVITLNNLTAGAIGAFELTPIQLDLVLEDKINTVSADVQLAGQVALNKTLTRFGFRDLDLDMTATLPDTAPLTVSTTLNGEADLDAGTINLEDTPFRIADLTGNLNLAVSDINDNATVQGSLTINSFSLVELMQQLKQPALETQNPDAFNTVSVSTDIAGTLPDINLNNLKVGLDNSTLTGSAGVSLNDITGIRFDLALDAIDVADYLSPTPEEPEHTAATAPQDSEVLPVELLNSLAIDGTFSIAQLNHDALAFTNLQSSLTNSNGKLNLQTRMQGYSGDFALKVAANTRARPGGSLTLDVTNINLTEFVASQTLTGTLTLASTANFNGKMLSQVLDSLTGTNTFTVTDGTLDVSPVKQAAAVIDGLRGEASGIADWPDTMPFTQMNGSLTFKDGIAADQQLKVALETLTIDGTGGLDYWQNTMDYNLGITLQQVEGSAFSAKPPLAGLRWPLRCRGELDASPAGLCRPDSDGIKRLVGDLVKQEVKRKGTEKVREAIGNKLKGLFN